MLLTLTMLSILSLKASRLILRRFLARVQREYGKSVRYIAVPEWQKRGAVHFHVLLWGLPEQSACSGYVKKSRGKSYFVETCHPDKPCERYTRHLQHLWLRGFCDLIETDGSPKLAGYLAKYLQKGLLDKRLGCERSYSVSSNILRPLSISAPGPFERDMRIGVDNPPVQVHEFQTQWLGRCVYQRFNV